MKECINCHVRLRDFQKECPFCHEKFGSKGEAPVYPVYDYKKLSVRQRIFPRIVALLAIFISAVSVFINVLTWKGYPHLWSIFVVGGAMYLWLTIGNTILSKMHGGGKIILQTISLSALAVLIDVFSGFHRWSVNIVVPFIVIAHTLLITIIVFAKKMLWNAYIGYTITMLFLCFLPILLFVCRIATSFWACALSGLYALLTLAAMFIFARKDLKDQFVSRFHF